MISKPLENWSCTNSYLWVNPTQNYADKKTLYMISNIGIFENEKELRRFEENINHCSDTPQFMMYVVIS